jgi:hypothetical protein
MQMINILYLLKCLDSKKLYFWIQVGRQILSWIQNPKKATYTQITSVAQSSTDSGLAPEMLQTSNYDHKLTPFCQLDVQGPGKSTLKI